MIFSSGRLDRRLARRASVFRGARLLSAIAVAAVSGCSTGDRLPLDASVSGHRLAGGVMRDISFTTNEGTLLSLDVSPDGRHIVFDLLGDLYILPIEGGTAALLLGGGEWDELPRYSPDGAAIRFVRNRYGSPFGGGETWEVPIDGGEPRRLSSPPPRMMDAARIGGSEGARFFSEYRRQASRNGEYVAYFARDPQRRWVSELRLRHLASGTERPLMSLPRAGDGRIAGLWGQEAYDYAQYAFTPDDRALVVGIGGKIWLVPLEGGPPRQIPFEARVNQRVHAPVPPRRRRFPDGAMRIRGIRAPEITPEGDLTIFTAVGRLWVRGRDARSVERLTSGDEIEDSAAISPDGRWLAYLAFPDRLQGENGVPAPRALLMIADLSEWRSGRRGSERVLVSTPRDYGPPTWFPDNRGILLTCPSVVSGPQPSFQHRAFCRADRLSGEVREIAEGPTRHVRHGRDAVRSRVSSADGRLYFVRESSAVRSRYTSAIVSAAADGTDSHVHLTVNADLEVVALSPSGRQAIAGDRLGRGVYLLNIPDRESATEAIELGSERAPKISDRAISYAFWQSDDIAYFGNGPELDRWRRDGRGAARSSGLDLRLQRHRASGLIAIVGARIITMSGRRGRERVLEDGTIVVRNGRIIALGGRAAIQVPQGATVLEGAGKTVIPGLIDVHFHRFAEPMRRATTDADMILPLAYGVTTIFNPSASTAPTDVELEGHEIIETGAAVSPRYFYSGHTIGFDYPIGSLQDARYIARHFSSAGSVLLKEYTQDDRAATQYLARAASEYRIGVTSEGASLSQVIQLVADGYNSVEHFAFIMPIYSDVVEFLSQSRVNFTPTVNTSRDDYQGSYLWHEEYFRSHPTAADKLSLFAPRPYRESIAPPAAVEARPVELDGIRAAHVARSAAQIINADGNISVGGHTGGGLLTHFEMWAIQRAGVSEMGALRAATLNGALKIGVDQEVGSLEVGKLADFLVLDSNPLQDIRNSIDIRYVVANGAVFDAATMTQLWPVYRRLPCMGWQTDAECAQVEAPPPLSLGRGELR